MKYSRIMIVLVMWVYFAISVNLYGQRIKKPVEPPGVTTEKLYIDGQTEKIPMLIARKNDGKSRPAIICLSGAPGDKYACQGEIWDLTTKEYVGVAYDPRTRGERAIKIEKPIGFGTIFCLEQIGPTAKDISAVIDYLQKQPYIIPDKIGMTGFSAGAMTTILACTYDHRLAAAAARCGSGNYAEMAERSKSWPLFPFLYGAKTGLGPSEEEKKLLNDIDPIFKTDKFYPVPLFLSAGSKDDMILASDVKSLYEKLMPYYKDAPEKLVYKEYPCGHEGQNQGMINDVTAFLEKYLKK